MSALAHEALSRPAQRCDGLLRQLLADKLVDALKALEQAHGVAKKAHRYCSAEDQQKCDLAEIDARTDLYRIMNQLGLDMRVCGSAMA